MGDKKLVPKSLDVDCFGFDDQTPICYDRNCIRDLFHADNIKGLYFLKEKQPIDTTKNKTWNDY